MISAQELSRKTMAAATPRTEEAILARMETVASVGESVIVAGEITNNFRARLEAQGFYVEVEVVGGHTYTTISWD